MVGLEEADVLLARRGDRAGARPGGVVVHLAEDEVDDLGEAAVGDDRDAERQDAVAELGLAVRQRCRVVRAGRVELGEDDGARHVHLGALVPQRPRRRIDAFGARDDEERGVGRPQTRPQLADEVRIAGGVDEIEHDLTRGQTRDVEAGRALVGAGWRPMTRGRRRDDVVEEAGLARPARTDQDDIAKVVGVAGDWGLRARLSGHDSPCLRGVGADKGPKARRARIRCRSQALGRFRPMVLSVDPPLDRRPRGAFHMRGSRKDAKAWGRGR